MIEQIEMTSEKLIAAGLRPGERIAVLSENSADFAAVVLGLWRIGAVAVPLSTRYKGAQLKDAVGISLCSKLFVSREFGDIELDADKYSIEDFSALTVNQISSLAFDDFGFDLDRDASVIFTSASTSKPKGVMHTIANHYYSALGAGENIAFGKGDRWLMSLPMYHISGFSLIMRVLVGQGAIHFPEPGVSICDAVKNTELTHISLVAAQLSELLESTESIKRLRKFKAILVGGSATPVNLIKRSLENGLAIFTTYGSTEMASQITTTACGDLESNVESSGKLLSFREVKIAGDGEILVKGKTLFKGYVNQGSTELPIDDEGYFRTNDIGSVDGEGNLFVAGRKDLMFISGGENIHPQQIERAIERIDNVERAIVIAVDDEKFGKRAVAFVKMQKGQTLDAEFMETELRKSLESFKTPKSFHLWPEEISVSMKPDRKKLTKYL